MTNLILKGVVCAAVIGVGVSCTDGYGPYVKTSDKGTVTLKVDVDKNVVGNRNSRAEFSDITASDLSVRLSSSDGEFTQSWNNLSDFPNDQELNVGQYTIEVFYDKNGEVGFEAPVFYGAQDVIVRENEVTEVALTASLKNSIIDIDYSDDFKNYMTSWQAEIQGQGLEGVIVAADEYRPVYTTAGRTNITVEFTKPNGKGGRMQVATFDAAAGHFYHVKVDVGGNGAGVVDGLTLTIDDTVTEQDITLDISDEVLSAPAPVIKANGFDAEEPIEFVAGFVGDMTLRTDVIGQAALKSLVIRTESASLQALGWPAEMDLFELNDATRGTVESLGLSTRGIFNNPGQMAILDFSEVVKHIQFVSGDNNLTTISLSAIDRYGKVSEPMTFSLQANEPKLQLISGQAYLGSTTATVDFSFNAGSTENLKFENYNSGLGVWQAVKATCATLDGSSTANYRATLNLTSNVMTDVRVRVSMGGMNSNVLEIERIPQVLASGAANAFAYKAYIPVTIGPKDSDATLFASLVDEAQVYVSTDGENFTAAETAVEPGTKLLVVKGLTPGTNYTAKIRNGRVALDGASTFAIATEADAQLPNGNLDNSEQVASGSYWERYDFEGGWGTNNHMTTADGANYAYVRLSGTSPVTDSHSGKAVLLCTHGWGSGNTATGSKGTSGNCKYTDAGLLHLGSNRTARPAGYGSGDNISNKCSTGPVSTDDLECGIAWNSRPSAVSFWYKYSPKNSADKGYAEVWVMDAEGNKFAAGTLTLDATNTYTQKTITLNYDATSPKAAKIYVKFLSSYDMEYIKRSDANFSGPGFANLSRGTFMGSKLYIDDINLEY